MLMFVAIISIIYSILLIKCALSLDNISQGNLKKEYKVSVIIPFRNEEKNILNSLRSVQRQSYNQNLYEVIYVNDNSTDDSKEILINNIENSNIKVIDVKNDGLERGFKKKAIEHGIKNSSGEIIILTDADCIHKKNWIKNLIKKFDENTGMVCGPVDYITQKEFFENLQKLEFRSLIIMGASLIGMKLPIIANGANIAFRKEAFNKVGGYGKKIRITSGDDEYLMHKIFYKEKMDVKFCADTDAMVLTYPTKNIKEFFNQRKRWASKSIYYNKYPINFIISILTIYYLTYFVTLIYTVISFDIYPLALIVLSKIIFEFLVMKKGYKKIYSEKKLKYFFVAELFHVPYIIISLLLGLKGNYQWKGRVIKR